MELGNMEVEFFFLFLLPFQMETVFSALPIQQAHSGALDSYRGNT